jgi:hypothetical protein
MNLETKIEKLLEYFKQESLEQKYYAVKLEYKIYYIKAELLKDFLLILENSFKQNSSYGDDKLVPALSDIQINSCMPGYPRKLNLAHLLNVTVEEVDGAIIAKYLKETNDDNPI